MSNARSFRRRRHATDRARALDAATRALPLSLAMRGCRCEPWVQLHHLAAGIWHVDVQHDHDCPAITEAPTHRGDP